MIELREGEQILLLRRRHWLPMLGQALVFVLMALFPFAVAGDASVLPEQIRFGGGDYLPYTLFFETAWVFLLWIVFAAIWTNYYLDIFVVTNYRLIDVEQIGFFSRNVAEMRLEHVQDTTVETAGLLQSLLNFGNLHIQSAAEQKEFVIKNIIDPQSIQSAISKQCHEISAGSYRR